MTVLSLVIAAACLAVAKADYWIQGIYSDKATCEAEGVPNQAILDVIDSSLCVDVGAGLYGRAGCKSNGDLIYAIFTSSTCADSSFSYNSTYQVYSPCSAMSGSSGLFTGKKCYSGTFSTKIPVAIQQGFSDDKCAQANGLIKASKQSNLYPLDKCVDSGTSSVKYTCSGGKPTATLYGANKCSGASQSQSFPTDCTANAAGSGGGSFKWAACASSGAASTSVTFLALGILVFATFSSAM